MPDFVIIASIVSGVVALPALGLAVWHHCRLEWLRHHPARPTDRTR